jgi:hypothetical protein
MMGICPLRKTRKRVSGNEISWFFLDRRNKMTITRIASRPDRK